ncbi:MAG TPA: SDR family NAD(P)-dependent oxidoreductase, partial [Anaerolineales bacterium]
MTGKKVVIVTGSARGIAVGLDILPEGERVADEIRKAGGEALFLKCDVSNEKQVADCVAQVVKIYSRVDVLVNNGGVPKHHEYQPGRAFPVVQICPASYEKPEKRRDSQLELGLGACRAGGSRYVRGYQKCDNCH